MDNNTRKILGLTDENIIFSEDWLKDAKIKGVTAQVIQGKLTYKPLSCKKCGHKNHGQIVKNGTKQTRTQMPVFRNMLTYLELKRSRFLCRDCGKTFVAETSIVAPNDHFSRALKQQIILELAQVSSRKSIAQRYFVSDVSILRIQEELAKARLSVRYLVMDMNASYQQLIKLVFPNAQVVTDRFHIVQQITRSLNQLRIKKMNSFNNSSSEDKKKYRRLKRYWKLLLKDSDSLDNREPSYHPLFKRHLYAQDIIDELLGYDEQLKLAYEAVQLLHYYRKKKDSDGFFSVIQTLDKHLPKWFRKKLCFLNKHKQGIQNAFTLSYSNGVTEGLNNKIKLIKRVSYGYRNFYHLRDRIYIIQGLIFS